MGNGYDFSSYSNLGSLIDMLFDEAMDLESSDWFAWVDSHYTYKGERAKEAVKILTGALVNDDVKIRGKAAAALYFLFKHADHGCYNTETINALKQAGKKLNDAKTVEKDSGVLSEINAAIDKYNWAKRYCK